MTLQERQDAIRRKHSFRCERCGGSETAKKAYFPDAQPWFPLCQGCALDVIRGDAKYTDKGWTL